VLAPTRLLRALTVAAGLALLTATAACSEEQTTSLSTAADKAGAAADKAGAAADKANAVERAGSLADRATAAAERLSGPAKAASDSLAASLAGAKGKLPSAAKGLADNARCVSDGTVGVLGDQLVERYRAAGADLADTSALTAAKARALRQSVDACVAVQPVLVGALVQAGLPADKAACVADRALSDDKVLASIMVNLVFGDPGLLTVTAVAVRAGAACLSPSELTRLLPKG
jgi:hypothetical protein